MNEAEGVVVQEVLEGLGQSFVGNADQQAGLVSRRPEQQETRDERNVAKPKPPTLACLQSKQANVQQQLLVRFSVGQTERTEHRSSRTKPHLGFWLTLQFLLVSVYNDSRANQEPLLLRG